MELRAPHCLVASLILGMSLWTQASTCAAAAGERTWAVLAGRGPGTGVVDGPGPTAQFNGPGNIALDGAGNLYVLDQYDTVVRRVAPNGTVTTFAQLPDVKFDINADQRAGIAVDKNGTVYVSEPSRDRLVKIAPNGFVTPYAGSQPGRRDGPALSALFAIPAGLALDTAGNLYVADSGNSTIRKITPQGIVTTIAGGPRPGLVDGPTAKARFDTPASLAIDKQGNIYVTEFLDVDNEGRPDRASTLRKIGVDGKATTLIEDYFSDARENYVTTKPTMTYGWHIDDDTSIALDSQGLLYIFADGGLKRVDPSKHYEPNSPTGLDIQDVPDIVRGKSVGIAISERGDVYVSDSDIATIFKAAP